MVCVTRSLRPRVSSASVSAFCLASAFGHAAPTTDSQWPKVTSFPTLAELALALRHKVEPWMLLLDRASPDGYVRDWQPPGLSPLRHWSYAFQWWLFAVTLLVIWVIMSIRRQEPRAS